MASKEYYEYVRDDQNRPVGTICTVVWRNDGDGSIEWSVGAAICSEKMPAKKIGRLISKMRAIKVCSLRQTLLTKKYYGKSDKKRIPDDTVLGTYMPVLNEAQKKIVKRMEEMLKKEAEVKENQNNYESVYCPVCDSEVCQICGNCSSVNCENCSCPHVLQRDEENE